MWEATPFLCFSQPSTLISIHASRVRGDAFEAAVKSGIDISIHASRVRGDRYEGHNDTALNKFQSTPLVWEATCRRTDRSHGVSINFNPRLSCERRPWRRSEKALSKAYFNPRLSCERRQDHIVICLPSLSHFNPRLSCERRQYKSILLCGCSYISIHASRVRGDFYDVCQSCP